MPATRIALLAVFSLIALLPAGAKVNFNVIVPQREPQVRVSFSRIKHSEFKFEHYGVEHIKSDPVRGFQGIVSYYHPVTSKLALSLGLGMSSINGSFFYDFNAPLNHNLFPDANDHYQESCFTNNLFMLPMAVHYRHNILKKFRISASIEAGISINVHGNLKSEQGMLYIYSDQASGTEIISFIFELKKPRPIFNPSGFVKLGLVREAPNGNNIYLAFVANYSPFSMRQGEYKFNYLYYDSYGAAKQYFNYIGIEVCYGIILFKGKDKSE